MAEQLLHCPEVGAAFEQVRGIGVSERVGVEGAAVRQGVTLEHTSRVARREWAAATIEEHDVAR